MCLLLVYFVYVCVDLPNVEHLGGGMGGGGGDRGLVWLPL